MIKHSGLQLTLLTGGVISATGLFIASFANDVYVIIATFGFITGKN